MRSEALPPDQQAAAEAGLLKPHDRTDSTPSMGLGRRRRHLDYRKPRHLGQSAQQRTLLNPTWQRKRLDSVQSTNPGSPAAAGYGLAIGKFVPMYGHTGELPGFQSFTVYDPIARSP